MLILREFDRRRHLAALDRFRGHLATDLPYEIRQRLTVIVGVYERLYVRVHA